MGAFKITILFFLLSITPGLALSINNVHFNNYPDTTSQSSEGSNIELKLELLFSSTDSILHKNPIQAIELAKAALQMATEQNYETSIAKASLIIARANTIIGNYTQAIENLEEAHNHFSKSLDSIGLIESFQLFGQIYTRIGDFKKALDNTQEAFNIAGSIGLQIKIAELARETGNIYFYFNEKAIALDFYQKSLKISEENKDRDGIAKAYNNMGRLYSELGNSSLALECLKKSLTFKIKEEDRVSYGNSLLNIGTVYLKANEYDKALAYLDEAFNDFSFVNNAEGMANSLYYSGLTYFSKGGYNQALTIQNKAWNIASETDSKRLLVSISLALSEVYAQKGDFKSAYNHFKLYNTLRDSVFGEEKSKLLIELETRYQLHAKQRQIELLSKDKELKESEKKKANFLIAFLSSIALLFISVSLFVFNRFRFKSKSNKVLVEEIKHRKRVEAQLNEYQEQLENLVEERTWELKVAKEKAEESDKLKTAFLANMSHEIRTPMNAILGFSYLITDPESSEPAKQEYVKIIKSNAEMLMNLINDILDISLIESGEVKLKTKPIEVNGLLNELKCFFDQEKEKYRKNHLKIIVDFDRDLEKVVINTDNVRLRQIISNLLSNAIKFTDEGRVEFGYRLSGENGLIFFIKDTGIGIDPKNHQAIFDRFSKFSIADESKLFPGTGLGLAICSELVNLLGGKIWLDSFPGKGSTFYFTLPCTLDESSEILHETKRFNNNKDRLAGKTILVAEDVVSNYQLLNAFLSQSQVNVLWAQNGVEAVDIFTKNRNIDIILMDIQMPLMDGLMALKKIREIDTKIPVIVNSAFYKEEEMEKSLASGCTEYMSKPLRKEDLLIKLSHYIG